MKTGLPPIRWRAVGVRHFIAVLYVLALMGFLVGLVTAKGHASQRTRVEQAAQANETKQINDLLGRLSALEDEIGTARAEEQAAKAQANTSVGQLVDAGQRPIIAAPGVVTVPPPQSTFPPPVTRAPSTAPVTSATTTTTAPAEPTTAPPDTAPAEPTTSTATTEGTLP